MGHNLNHSQANRTSHRGEGLQCQTFREPTRAEYLGALLMADHAERVRSQRPQPSAPRKFSWEV